MKYIIILIIIPLLYEKSYSQINVDNSEFQLSYQENYFEADVTYKPRRKNFKWLSKIGFDSIAVEAGFNNRQFVKIYKYPVIPCKFDCNPIINLYNYKIINYHMNLNSYDNLSNRIILLKGISLLRQKSASDYIPVYGPQYKHYSENSFVILQFPLLLGLNFNKIHAFGGIILNTYKFFRNERKAGNYHVMERSTDFDFSISPSLKLGYITKIKKITGGVYLGADLYEKYYLFSKFGFLYFIN